VGSEELLSHESLDNTKLSSNDKTPYNAYLLYMLNKPQVHLNRTLSFTPFLEKNN
jgi:hypothetical protein